MIAGGLTAWHWLLIAALILALQAAILYSMGRLPICACGYVKLWHGEVQSSENSQHIADWYTLSHIVHGFLFYGLAYLLFPRLAWPGRLIFAMLVEGTWELVENSNLDHRALPRRHHLAGLLRRHHRQFDLGYAFDDRRLPGGKEAAGRRYLAVALLFELVMALHIRDNLTLNIIMLIHPFEAIKLWQAGPPII